MNSQQTDGALQAPPKPAHAVIDIVAVVGVSLLTFLAEIQAREAGLIPLGDDSRGVFAVLGGAVTAVALLFARGGRWKDLGFYRPKRLMLIPIWVIGIFTVFMLMQGIAATVVSLLFELPQPDYSRYEAYHGNLSAALTFALLLPFTASIPEEIIYRGFLMNRLTQLFGNQRSGNIRTVLIQALLFGSVHFQWGLGGMLFTSVMGLVWGTAYLMCGRNLWIVILAHSTGHALMAIQLYLTPPV